MLANLESMRARLKNLHQAFADPAQSPSEEKNVNESEKAVTGKTITNPGISGPVTVPAITTTLQSSPQFGIGSRLSEGMDVEMS